MLEEKLVFAKSPSLLPRPVKSKRKTPSPRAVSSVLIREAASVSLEQVKQCANRANAAGLAGGRSSRAASMLPHAPGKRIIVRCSLITPPVDESGDGSM